MSADFLASDFIYDEELPPLLKDARPGGISLVIIPITASPYETTPLASRQFVHPPSQPLDGMAEHERNAAFVRIVKEIAEAARRAVPDLAAAAVVPAPRAETAPAPVAPTGRMGELHGVPGQRPNYLRRQEYLDRLKQALLGDADRAVCITGTRGQGARVGLHGRATSARPSSPRISAMTTRCGAPSRTGSSG